MIQRPRLHCQTNNATANGSKQIKGRISAYILKKQVKSTKS